MRPPTRRAMLARLLLASGGASPLQARAETVSTPGGSPPSPGTPAVPRGRPLPPLRLAFPRDHGAHPALRTEWWYLTGRLLADARVFGFQVTFFRSRVDATQGMTSAFAARQLLFAHAAVTDLASGRLVHDQRIARAGFGLAQASEEDTDLRLGGWRLQRHTDGSYRAQLTGQALALDLQARPTQPLLLQGRDGLSRKGPEPTQASYYYSQPQLATEGQLGLEGRSWAVGGRAWLDHEWSEAVMHPQAVGWDWVGMNLDDGSVLTVFRLRRADGSAVWAGGSWRTAGGTVRPFESHEVRMVPGRLWRSPRSGAQYPVDWTLETPAGPTRVRALVDAQELDSRASTGTIYWEGLSVLEDRSGRPVGHGYLEMTGYAAPLRL